MSLDILAVIVESLAPIILLGGALFIVGGFFLALVIPFLFVVRVGIPRL